MKNPGGIRPSGGTSSTSPIEVHITSGVVAAANGTKYTPSGNTSTSRRANPTPSRVLPDPPGPVNVTNRTPGEDSNAANSASSPSRPTNEVAGTGRLDAAPNDFTAANSVCKPGDVQLEQVLGRDDVLQLVSTQITQPHLAATSPARSAATNPAVASDTSTCPPWAAPAIRAARCTSIPTYPPS